MTCVSVWQVPEVTLSANVYDMARSSPKQLTSPTPVSASLRLEPCARNVFTVSGFPRLFTFQSLSRFRRGTATVRGVHFSDHLISHRMLPLAAAESLARFCASVLYARHQQSALPLNLLDKPVSLPCGTSGLGLFNCLCLSNNDSHPQAMTSFTCCVAGLQL